MLLSVRDILSSDILSTGGPFSLALATVQYDIVRAEIQRSGIQYTSYSQSHTIVLCLRATYVFYTSAPSRGSLFFAAWVGGGRYHSQDS